MDCVNLRWSSVVFFSSFLPFISRYRQRQEQLALNVFVSISSVHLIILNRSRPKIGLWLLSKYLKSVTVKPFASFIWKNMELS